MRPRWTTTAPPTGNGRWLTSRLCALGLMVEEDDAAEILGRASYAGFSPEAGASAIAATNIVLDRGQIREEIRSGSHQRYFRACRARGYETWTVAAPVRGYTSVQEMVAVTEITADLVLNRD